MDAADCNSECLRYAKHIHVLFVLGECVRTGYTKYALDLLRRPKAFVVNGTARTVGSKDPQPRSVVDAALKHMQCWTRLAIQTLRAEHPDFELVAAFQILKINSRLATRDDDGNQNIEEHVKCLAEALVIEEEPLRAEFLDLQRIAADQRTHDPTLSNKDCWKRAYELVTKRHNQRGHPSSHILRLLVMWFAWLCTSAGVEHSFSQVDRVYSTRRKSMSRQALQDVITLIMDRTKNEEGKVLALAQKLWKKYYGRVRRKVWQGARLRPLGTKRALPPNVEMSEGSFVAKRRRSVSSMTQALTASQAMDVDGLKALTDEAWTDSMDKEELFQKRKRQRRLLEAIHQRVVADHPERTEAFERMRAQEPAKERQRQRDRDALQTRMDRALTSSRRGCGKLLQGAKVFFEDAEHIGRAEIKTAVRRNRMVVLRTRIGADVIVADSVASLGQRSRHCLRLFGGHLLGRDFLLSDGADGWCFKYSMAVSTARLTWVSAACASQHPAFFKVLDAAVSDPRSKWKWFHGSNDEFLHAVKRTRGFIGFVTKRQKAKKAPQKQQQRK